MAALARSTERSPANSGSTSGATDLHRKYDLPDLAAHEAIPGHVWQGEYANRLPLIRTLLAFNAYSEGWALYAEQLVDELGVYDDFPAGRLGLPSVNCVSRLPAGRRHRASCEALAASVKRSTISSASTDPTRKRSRTRSIVTASGRARPAATRSDRTRSSGSREKAKQELGSRIRPTGPSTTRWSRAAMFRWTCSRPTSTIYARGPRRLERERQLSSYSVSSEHRPDFRDRSGGRSGSVTVVTHSPLPTIRRDASMPGPLARERAPIASSHMMQMEDAVSPA